jgi:putative transposase
MDQKVYLFVHLIWSTARREPLLKKPVRHVLFAYVRSLAEQKMIRLAAINGVEDHIHLLIQLHPTQSLSQVIKQLKEGSSLWLNENKLLEHIFEWQEDYAAYSVSPSVVKQVGDYIARQEEYHKTKSFESELESFDRLKESL